MILLWLVLLLLLLPGKYIRGSGSRGHHLRHGLLDDRPVSVCHYRCRGWPQLLLWKLLTVMELGLLLLLRLLILDDGLVCDDDVLIMLLLLLLLEDLLLLMKLVVFYFLLGLNRRNRSSSSRPRPGRRPVENVRPARVDRLQQQWTLLHLLLLFSARALLRVLILQLDVVRVGLLDGVHELPDQAVVPRRQQVVGLLGNARVEQQRPVQRRRHRRQRVRDGQLAEHVRQAGQPGQGGNRNARNIAVSHDGCCCF